MKNIFISIVFSLLPLIGINAQDAYNEIRSKSVAQVNDPLTNDMVRQINQFKVDALDYMLIKMREQMPDSNAIFLDHQAVSMNGFIGLYIKKILEFKDLPEARQVKIIKKFMDASYSNPLFNDPDTELTLGYYSKGDCLTRFSLDTDWQKALAAIENSLKINNDSTEVPSVTAPK